MIPKFLANFVPVNAHLADLFAERHHCCDGVGADAVVVDIFQQTHVVGGNEEMRADNFVLSLGGSRNLSMNASTRACCDVVTFDTLTLSILNRDMPFGCLRPKVTCCNA